MFKLTNNTGKISSVVKEGGNLTSQAQLEGEGEVVCMFWREIWPIFKMP